MCSRVIGIGDVGAGRGEEGELGPVHPAFGIARRPDEEGEVILARRRGVALAAFDVQRIGAERMVLGEPTQTEVFQPAS